MSDLVHRLRNWWYGGGMSGAEANADDLIQEAADEIEKLRAALRVIARQPENDEESAQAVARAALGEKG